MAKRSKTVSAAKFPRGRGLRQPFARQLSPPPLSPANRRYVHHPWLFDDRQIRWFRDYELKEPDTAWYHQLEEDPVTPRKVYKAWTSEQERVVFLRYNYFRMKAIRAVQHKRGEKVRETWEKRADGVREIVAAQNLGLVLKMSASRLGCGEIWDNDFVSEGNLALLRAIDLFDVGRGFKFSTYACRAIIKAHSRELQKKAKIRRRESVSYADADAKHFEPSYVESTREDDEDAYNLELLHKVLDRNLAGLKPIEQQVVRIRFQLDRERDGRVTLADVGEAVGLTKERVRQIQNEALLKLREAFLASYDD